MYGRGPLHLLAAGAAAALAIAIAAVAWRREQQVAAAAAAKSGASDLSNKPATPQADSSAAATSQGASVEQHSKQQDQQTAHVAAAAAAAPAASAEQQVVRERAAAVRHRASSLYRVTPNERIVHEMLLSGQEGGLAFLQPGEVEPGTAVGAPPHMAAGRSSTAAAARTPSASVSTPAPAPSEGAAAAEEIRRSVVNTVEQAFFDALGEGLRRGKTEALASLLLDARDQLAALLPQHPPGGGTGGGTGGRSSEGAQLLADLREKLDEEYVAQRLQRYDAAFAAQCFDFLVHVIGRLQAPARRQHTQEAYAEVAALFVAAGQADASAASVQDSIGGSVAGRDSPAVAHEEGSVHLQLSIDEDSKQVGLRLMPASAAAPAGLAAPAASNAAGSSAPQLEWQLRLAPRPDGGMAAVLVPVEVGAEAASPTTEEAQQAGGAGGSTSGASTSSCSGMGEGSVAAMVAAARFLHHQLNELKADVAAARLSMLKEAILGNGSAIEYERQRYLRAVQQPGEASPASGSSSTAAGALADAFPITVGWLKEALQQAPPAPGLEGAAFTQAVVESVLLLLLQRTRAVGPADCPETLLLDLEAVVVLQNELQRLCLVAASLLVVQQILAAQRALPPAGSPRHAALCQRLVRRVGLLLSAGVNLQALAVELHGQIEQEMAAGSEQPPAGTKDMQMAAKEAAGARSGGSSTSAPNGSSGDGSSSETCPVELATVRRMIEGIFSTSHTVYQRVQAGIVAALTALLRSAAGPSPAGSRSGSPGPRGSPGSAASHEASSGASATPSAAVAGDTWRKVLRGVGAEALASEVLCLGAALHRIASVSSAVAGPVVYAPLLAVLQAAAPAWQRRRH